MSERLTAGAERVLTRLIRRFESEQIPVPLFHELLHGLCSADGIAAEILAGAGVDPGLLNEELWGRSEPVVDFFAWRMLLVRTADRLAIEFSDEGETGTEHLLLAALDLDQSTGEVLSQWGVTRERIVDEISPAEPTLEVTDESRIEVQTSEQSPLEGVALERTLDAAANRCREGLRVVEDFVRFQLNGGLLSRELKRLRHELKSILGYLGQQKWIAARDTLHDVGTETSTAAEVYRGTVLDVLRASMKRVEEALRSLEEFSKLIDADLSPRLERCRYRFYTIEKAIETTLSSRVRFRNARLYLLVTDDLCRYGAEKTIRNTILAGVDIVQIREKSLTDRELIAFARRVREWTREADTLLMINDRPDIAAIVGADGVHLGQDDMEVHEARNVLGSNKLIGVSTHCPEQAQAAVLAGADYLGVGPVFSSGTKNFGKLAGLEYVEAVAREVRVPWFAIGGIDESNVGELLAAGAERVAVSGAICQAAHPKGVASTIAGLLKPAADA